MLRTSSYSAVLVALGLSGCHSRPKSLAAASVISHLPADGREHLVATLQSDDSGALRLAGVAASAYRFVPSASTQTLMYLRAPVQPGNLSLVLSSAKVRLQLPITLMPDNIATEDGTPDWMRLHSPEDRQAFRRWFTALGDRAADTAPTQTPSEITDCASFLRYCYRESLRAHDDRWYAQFPADSVPSLASVQQWSYPNTPLGVNLYRTKSGPFRPSDLSDGTFTQFADAKTLHADNAYLVGRSLKLAKPGDLIFYRVLEMNSQYHSMIITGEHGEWVVYNTGPDHGQHGEMRRVLLADLLHHPDPQWRPEAANPNWLGVYRWNILREE